MCNRNNAVCGGEVPKQAHKILTCNEIMKCDFLSKIFIVES